VLVQTEGFSELDAMPNTKKNANGTSARPEKICTQRTHTRTATRFSKQ
jgi:hypothetical protein